MLKMIAGAALTTSLFLTAISASDSQSSGRVHVNRAGKSDRLPFPQVQRACPQGYKTSCIYKNTQPDARPALEQPVRIVV
jgi:hypothetical protein